MLTEKNIASQQKLLDKDITELLLYFPFLHDIESSYISVICDLLQSSKPERSILRQAMLNNAERLFVLSTAMTSSSNSWLIAICYASTNEAINHKHLQSTWIVICLPPSSQCC